MVEAKRLIESGAIGDLYGVEMHMVADQTRLGREGYGERWEAQQSRSGGGHLVWLGIHWLDLAMFITDTDIKSVAGFTANVGGKPFDVEDSATAALQFSNGTLGTVTSGYYTDEARSIPPEAHHLRAASALQTTVGGSDPRLACAQGYNSHMKFWGSKGWVHLEPHGPVRSPPSLPRPRTLLPPRPASGPSHACCRGV